MKKTDRSVSVKHEQRKSFLLREVSSLIQKIAADEPSIAVIFVNRVELSADSGICYVYFATFTDKKAFDDAFELLKMYKPSMRHALSKQMHGRYVPNLVFLYDETKEKERRMNVLLNQIADESKDDE